MPNNEVRRLLEEEEWGMLSTRIQAGEYAFFVASGLSTTAGLPTGAELAKKMIEKLYPNPATAVALFRKRFGYQGELDLPVVTELVEEKYGRERMIRHLISCVTRWNPAPSSTHNFFHLLALKIEPSGKAMRIITTNFDELLERSLPASREVIVTDEQYRMGIVREDEPWVLKVHGCIRTQPIDTIRITTTDLRKPLETWKRTAVQSILALRGLIVIGYGATDIHIKRIIVAAIRQSVRETYWVSLGEPSRQVFNALSAKDGKFLKMDAMTFFKKLGMEENN